MSKKRRTFSKDFKAKVALEALRERESLQDLAKRYELHPNQIIMWKKQLKERLPELFSRKNEKQAEDKEAELSRLYEEIGRLKVDRDWLKKKLDQP